MQKLARYDKVKLIDLLSERLAFERAGVGLYDSVLDRLDSSTALWAFREELEKFRADEMEHRDWLASQIERLGGDPDVETDLALLVDQESAGIQMIVAVDDVFSHAMHALLSAELMDNAGWELLIELADDADDREAREEFRVRLHQEENHLLFARTTMLALVRKAVLGIERRA
jgi:rubrerythrin